MRSALTTPEIQGALARLAREIEPALKSRGRSYRHQVRGDLEVEDDLLVCKIQGSARRPYEVVIDFSTEPPEGVCSCPYSGDTHHCKHVAAVVDALLDGPVPSAPAAPAPRSPSLRSPAPTIVPRPPVNPLAAPLARVESALTHLARASARPEERGGVLFWEIDLLPSHVVVSPIVRKRLKAGGLGAVKRLRLDELTRRGVDLADPRDARIASLVQGVTPAYYSRWDSIRLPALHLLEILEGHPQVVVRPGLEPVALARATAGVAATVHGDGACRLAVALDGRPVVQGAGTGSLTADGIVALDPEVRCIRFASVTPSTRLLLGAIADLPPHVPRDVAAVLLDRIASTAPALPLALPRELEGEPVEADTRVVLRLTPTESGGAAVEVRYRPVPGGPLVEPGAPPARLGGTHEGVRRVAVRDLGQEAARARDVCRALTLAPDERLGWTTLLETDDDVLDLLGRLEGELPGPVLVEWPEGERRRLVTAPSTAFKIGLESQQDWFGVTGGLEIEGELVALGVLLAAARDGRRYVSVGKGRFVELARVFGGRLEELALVTRDGRGKVELPRAAVPLALDLLDGVALTKRPASWTKLARRVRELDTFETELPEGLEAELRPYQRDGYRWLARLAELGIGGCLADDMGTGKTVQAIAALLARRDEGPALVVAPTSVGFNWLRELARFAPSLRARSYRSGDRKALLESARRGDVVVASYGLLRQDAIELANVEWGTVVLDEAQAIKNAATDTARAARGLDAKWTVALTGTPVENHLGELWSLFHTVAPGLLGSWEQFAARFAGPIERDRSAKRRAALARVVRPFILRRTKADVLKDLPPRTEVRHDVVLSKAERALYENARLEALARLASPARGRDQRFEVLAELTRLRQLACHARLVEPKAPRVSAKLALLLEQLEEVLEGDHRALVFSQFTRHLDLVGEALAEKGVRALRLDGSTPPRERERLVTEFQAGAAPVFLISLKAGGTGLNLTAADYVFHLDPWWNPAVEDQAADRAHRIGQARAVTVVRLVARDTIEEKVLALHADKRELVAGILDGTERAAKLTTADLLALLREGAREAGSVEVADEPEPEAPAATDAAAVSRPRASTRTRALSRREPAAADTGPLRLEPGPLEGLVERFRAHVVSLGAARGSAGTYAREVRSLVGDALTGDAASFERRFLSSLATAPQRVAGLSPSTRNVKGTSLSRFLGFLAGEERLLGAEGRATAQDLVARIRG